MTAADVDTCAEHLDDEYTLLLWQACAHADGLLEAQERGAAIEPLRDGMLEFLRGRLLPYLSCHERAVAEWAAAGCGPVAALLDDHRRIRAEVDAVAAVRAPQALLRRSQALVNRLDAHLRREEHRLPA